MGSIEEFEDFAICHLSSIGLLVNKEVANLDTRFEGVTVERYVIMPNHIHILLSTSATCKTSVSDIIGVFKSLSTRAVNVELGRNGTKLWQPGFHDHIVRNEIDYARICEYIENNPKRWALDKYHVEQ